ncbi:uncharacterized protein LOC110964340 [Acanthochromis polyacanthus]|uniref:uncharacterized protein LOC110964340 n=1 Tax=Acanthochromis polyacanthus TaxID=80966 RepID=UPI0022348DE7|nr:uncharacterized protein LOC110964340 [Acanthochromis polyacanthus]XP_051792907.1 uncharacterized protein LOC110964340 [Acanthochromis polyacanthus]
MSEYGQGTGTVWIDQIECNGMESSLPQCPQRPFTDKTCNTSSVAGVTCTGSLEVRLANGKDECSGRVEVRHGDVWSTVCDAGWTVDKAQAVCDLLECGRAVNIPGTSQFGQGSGSVATADDCFSNATFLQQCSSRGFRAATCGHQQDAGAICAAQVRLAGGATQCSGRVEVFYKGQWGTVCDDEWELSAADVVCRQLGCGHAISAPGSAHFGQGSGPIWLDNVQCSGQESALSHCTHQGFGEHNCGHGEDSSAICLGALAKPEITLYPAPEVNWGDKVEITCTVVTEQLGGTFILKKLQDSFQLEKFSNHDTATFTFPAVDFNQRGSYFCEYQKKLPTQVIYYPQGNSADLSITVKLEKPTISLSSPHAMVVYSPDKVSVTQGSSFSVTCSTHSKYPGGFFYLTRSNRTTMESKPTFAHSIFYLAYFEFPSLEPEHQGEYTCVYALNISSLSFCSVPSKSLQVTVISPSSYSVVGPVVCVLVVLVLLVVGFLVWRRRWRGSGVMVQFRSRFEEAMKRDMEDRSNGALDGRERSNQLYEPGPSRSSVEKATEEDSENGVDRVPEDLAGRVCYELEPLVVS